MTMKELFDEFKDVSFLFDIINEDFLLRDINNITDEYISGSFDVHAIDSPTFSLVGAVSSGDSHRVATLW